MRSLFGFCLHRKLSRVFSNIRGTDRQPYVVCLSCAREFSYSLREMKIGAEIKEGVVSSGAVVEVER